MHAQCSTFFFLVFLRLIILCFALEDIGLKQRLK